MIDQSAPKRTTRSLFILRVAHSHRSVAALVSVPLASLLLLLLPIPARFLTTAFSSSRLVIRDTWVRANHPYPPVRHTSNTVLSYKRIRETLYARSKNSKVSIFATVDEATAVSNPSVRKETSNNPREIMGLRARTKQDFYGRNVLLTGASGGLGRSLALQLAACQPKMMILSARTIAALQTVVDECYTIADLTKTSIHIIPCDLANPVSVQELGVQALAKCTGGGTIDVLINNGGISSRSRFIDTDNTVDQQCMQVNFLAGAALAKAVIPGMLSTVVEDDAKPTTQPQPRGRIIWISSVQGLMGIPNRSSYAASKFAVQGYCESIRAELARDNIVVHCVSPGYINTNLSRSALTGTATATHGVLDAATAAGADPDDLAIRILNKVVAGHVDFTIAAGFSATVAMYLRLLCPGLLRFLLVKRYIKSLPTVKDKIE